MTEAERIEKDAAKYARFNYNHDVVEGAEYRGYIAGATAENERLQQLIKDYEFQTGVTENNRLETIKDLRSELKSAQELNRELVDAAKVICDREIRRFHESKLPSIYIENLRLLINKAK